MWNIRHQLKKDRIKKLYKIGLLYIYCTLIKSIEKLGVYFDIINCIVLGKVLSLISFLSAEECIVM